jgi:PAS domain-containing protein
VDCPSKEDDQCGGMDNTKFSSQLAVAFEQATIHFRRVLDLLTELANNAGRNIRELFAGSLDAAVVANAKISKFMSQLRNALKHETLHLRHTLQPLTERGKAAFQKIPELLAGSLDVAVMANAKIFKFGSRLLAALKEAPVHLLQPLYPLTNLGKNVLEKTRSLQAARRARENDMRQLLASSADAVVVTNVDRRFIAANPIALHLFGVSETNITQFTIDAFLLENEILLLDGNGLPFISREEMQGECKIRRLTGNLRMADYIFVANFLPFRHLFIFRNDREIPRRRAATAG